MNVLVLGDIMLDINYQAEVKRIAPEADIPIYNILSNNYILGGAANVAVNLKNLDVNVEIIGLVGNDLNGKKIKELLDKRPIKYKLFLDEKRDTTQKHRLFLNNKLQIRYDIEQIHDILPEIENEIMNYIINKQNIHAIILSDYDKGFLTESLCQNIINYANKNNIYTFVDPKLKNYLKYKNCFLFKPNIVEAELISNEKNIEKIIEIINEKVNCKNLLITNGKEGMIINSVSNKIIHDSIIRLVDVTGAGDIVIAVLVYMFLKEKDLFLACKFANYVAGKSVSVIGNYSVSIDDIYEYDIISDEYISESKIIYDYETDKLVKLSKKSNLVFTNGCFDILHSGHIKNLQFAKKQGDILVVGLNSDESIRKLKGPERPINNIDERTTILSLFDFVDYIIVFSEDTPFNILKILKPNILVKGSDYKMEDIVGKEFVEKVILFDYINGKSSTNVINEIKKKLL